MFCIPYACMECTSTLDKPWTTGVPLNQQPHYKNVKDCT